MASDISQTHEDTYKIISLLCIIYKSQTYCREFNCMTREYNQAGGVEEMGKCCFCSSLRRMELK
jgi:hypothetical protein